MIGTEGSMTQRLNVKSSVQKTRLYLAQHVATAETGEGEVNILASTQSIVLQFEDKRTEVEVPFTELVKAAMEVV